MLIHPLVGRISRRQEYSVTSAEVGGTGFFTDSDFTDIVEKQMCVDWQSSNQITGANSRSTTLGLIADDRFQIADGNWQIGLAAWGASPRKIYGYDDLRYNQFNNPPW